MRIRVLAVAAIGLLAWVGCPSARADEWLRLFDQETLFGWQAYGDAEWAVADGALCCAGGSGGWLATTSAFRDFELEARVRVAPGGSAALLVRAAAQGHPSENGSASILIQEPENGKGAWHDIRVKADGGSVTATLDGNETPVQGGKNAVGLIGVAYHRTGKVEVASLRLRPLNTKPLFNGTDLTGWNIIPGHKSEFAVVDGAINIKNGNGQIETAGVYKDFLLQLDIISNGKSLNSGVFYRGPVGVFWKGYESQVRNQWVDDDRTKPVDFGTGGNYGNQPARKVVSSDFEWFTKTIVANGNHCSVWINGLLVSDYLDMRPVSEQADGKKGYVPGPGTIHLQGHDPSTDLSFKNIVIQEYPSE